MLAIGVSAYYFLMGLSEVHVRCKQVESVCPNGKLTYVVVLLFVHVFYSVLHARMLGASVSPATY